MSKRGIHVFKLTNEDWRPSYQINGYYRGIRDPMLVKVALFELSTGAWRVCVWGADDFGMERDYSGEKAEESARAMFNHVLSLDYVRVQDLEPNGFQRA